MTTSRFARRPFVALLFAVSLTACGSSTSTPAVDPAQVQQRLDQFVASVSKPTPGSEFKTTVEGKATVETKDDGTVVGTLPRMNFIGDDGNTAVLDPIVVRFAPGGEGRVNIDATLPSAMQVKDKAGKVQGEVRIGSQTLKGVWVDKLQTIDDADFRLSNITISSPTEAGTGKIDQISLTGKFASKGSGLYDGRYDMAITGFNVDDPKEKSVVKMGKLAVVATMTGAKLEEWATAAKQAGYTLSNPEIFKAWTGGPIDPKMIAFLKRMPDYMGEVKYVYSAENVEATTEGKPVFAMKSASFGMGVGPDSANMTKVVMTMGLGGVAAGGEEPLLPPEADVQDATVEIEATGVPGRKLWEIYMDALPGLQAEAAKVAASGQDAATASTAALEQVGAELSGQFLQVLSAARLQLALNKLNLTTPTAKMTGKGAATYLPAEALMPEGRVSLRFSGIDALAKALQARGAQDETSAQLMGAIAGIRAMGKPDPASPKDDRAYIIDIVFTKDGKIMANGQDVMGGGP
jgi:hypothetical protein